MRQTIILLIALAIPTSRLLCQTALDDSLLMLEQRVFVCKNDSEKTELRLKKLNVYFSENVFSNDAFIEAKRIDYTFIKSKDIQRSFLWNASVLAYMNNDKRTSLRWYNQYRQTSSDSSMRSLLLGCLAASDFDSTMHRSFVKAISLQDSDAVCLYDLTRLQNYKRRHKGGYIAASAIIPGLGSALNGNVAKGAVSLAVNSAAWILTYELIRSNLYVNAALVGGAMGMKFYPGNIQLTKKLFEQKEAAQRNTLAKKCEQCVDQLLDKYSIGINAMH